MTSGFLAMGEFKLHERVVLFQRQLLTLSFYLGA